MDQSGRQVETVKQASRDIRGFVTYVGVAMPV